MGNKSCEAQFDSVAKSLIQDKLASKKLSIRSQQKYRQALLDLIKSSPMDPILIQSLQKCVKEQITKKQLIQTVSVISELTKNNYQSQISLKKFTYTIRPQSKNVVVNFDFKKGKLKKIPEQINDNQQTAIQKKKINTQKIRLADSIIRTQIGRNFHPFTKMNKVFAQYLVNVFIVFSKQSNDPAIRSFFTELTQSKVLQNGLIEEVLRKTIYKWCLNLAQTCIRPYKKWLLNYTELHEQKYQKWIIGIVLDEMWQCNDDYLFHIVKAILEKFQQKIDILDTQNYLITPQIFQIDQKLRIDGNYHDGFFEMAQLPNVVKPSFILKHLTNIKNAICGDVDKFYDLEKKQLNNSENTEITSVSEPSQPLYQINSDNILGIVSFIIYRIRGKIAQIDRQIRFLRVVYGQNIYFFHGQSSYMLSTIVASIQYLQSQNFRYSVNMAIKKWVHNQISIQQIVSELNGEQNDEISKEKK